MKETILNKSCGLLPKRNPSQGKDLKLLYELLPSLCDKGVLAIYFRFWERLLIEDIAKILDLSWNETNQLIENSIKELRCGFLMNQETTEPKAA